MFLKHLRLKHFRNYADQQVDFEAPKSILVGDNAQGKSNLLEAVELLATLRSHRTSRDRDLIQDGASIAQINAQLERDLGPLDVAIILRNGQRRTLNRNHEAVKRQADFLGSINAVQFSCLDLDLVRGGPGYRRVWLDTLLTQLEPIYVHLLQQYGQVLRQRNALLKQQGDPDADVVASAADLPQLALWDAQLATLGTHIMRRRDRVLQRLAPLAQSWHAAISGHSEVLEVHYLPNVTIPADAPETIQAAFLDKIQQRAIAERHQRTSLVGPHRDDVDFLINQTAARQYGSQGQQRTLVLSLKLAELDLLETVIGDPPLLLLDDVLAELDLNRQNQLLEVIQDRFQTLITTTHLGAFDAQWLKSSQVFAVKAGRVMGDGVA